MDGSQVAGETAKAVKSILAVSSDSHITEPPNCYIDYIDPAFRERAPFIAKDPEKGGEGFYVEGFARPIALGLLAAAGRDPAAIKVTDTTFEDLHRSGWDPAYRIVDQDRDGVQAEFIYPTVGMLICNHPDADYKNACMWAYNRWLQEYVAGAPTRLYGLGQMIVRSPAQAIADLTKMKEMGFKGVMMPGEPETAEDYDQPLWDPLWRACVELDMPISFHVLTGGMTKSFIEGRNTLSGVQRTAAEHRETGRGPQITRSFGIVRNCQDILAMFVFGRVFERHPGLKLVCVEADAGWAPHYMYRMDHYYKRHRHWQGFPDMQRLPSEYFKENIYLTFQDDWSAFQVAHLMNPKRLMWANDFPHSDSTWPWSQELLAEHAANLSEDDRAGILRDNCAELYKIDVVR
jgi:predicted TIM-barrel fold metal-dependent hydrolase